jgi:GTP diphosphokinase / guanosine-3',5'-bis(diphosphate) 3'-diphosphatase
VALDFLGKPETTPQGEVPAELLDALLDLKQPFDVDWRQPASELTEEQRLLRLARVKAVLPSDNALEEKTTHDATLENYIRLALTAAGDVDTLNTFLEYVRLTLKRHPEDAQDLAQQVFWIWAPAAEIAGMYHHKEKLEERAFKVLSPDEYSQIRQQYDRARLVGDDGLLERVRTAIEEQLDAVLSEGISYEMSARPKSNYSVWRKLRSEERTTAELYDLLGYRIILDGDDTEATEQCYVAIAAIAAEFESEKTRFKDYIAEPKATGYQSIHLTLYTPSGFPFEVQVRTRRMHQFAESDQALSHQTYEATYKEIPGKIQRVFRKIPRLYQWRNQATAHIINNNGSTERVLGADILFFRDDGNLYKAPSGLNALDASFYIHSRRALRTGTIWRGSKPIAYGGQVQHGDVINVQYRPTYPTEKNQFEKMARSVTTSHAKKSVEKGRRHALRQDYLEAGRQIVLSMVGDIGIVDPLAMLDEVDQRRLSDRVGVPDFESLLVLIGTGERSSKPTRVANFIRARCGIGQHVILKAESEKLSTLGNDDVIEQLVIPNLGGVVDCKVAGCCTEKIRRGDDVLVRPSKLDGMLKIHLDDCVNIRDRSDTISCSWAEE